MSGRGSFNLEGVHVTASSFALAHRCKRQLQEGGNEKGTVLQFKMHCPPQVHRPTTARRAKKPKPDEFFVKFRQGIPRIDAVREIGVTEQSYYPQAQSVTEWARHNSRKCSLRPGLLGAKTGFKKFDLQGTQGGMSVHSRR